MRYTLHIVEPTLSNQAGHCYGYVCSLLRAGSPASFDFHVWIDRRGASLLENENATVHPYFFYKLRKLQLFFCLRKIIRRKEALFIPTAGRLELILLDKLLGARKDQPVFFHFHQFNSSEKKRVLLRHLAHRHPEWVIMAPTERLLAVFKESGFVHCEAVPCPVEAPSTSILPQHVFKQVIYAGAPRADKGFSEVVDWVCDITHRGVALPVTLQVSPPFSGRFDVSSQAALARLEQLNNPRVVLHRESLSTEAYQQLFEGGIALLIYAYNSYRDKFSGVALSAFYAGCPVVTIADTWMGDVTEQFNAGVVVRERTPEAIQAAVDQIRHRYADYQANARRAGEALYKKHDPANTLAVIMRGTCPGSLRDKTSR